ncbi:MAG: hypothetical protein OXI95_09650 [bacterium]|nr:hypothetical protein [bacterium]MDE0417184.1 hypothetical protein [bacterium]
MLLDSCNKTPFQIAEACPLFFILRIAQFDDVSSSWSTVQTGVAARVALLRIGGCGDENRQHAMDGSQNGPGGALAMGL